jgi:NAD(P)-dependent dehydrogenase (short-subunit alcohol dehydrogenase family)
MADYNEWRANLHVYGLDLRDLKAVMDFTDMVGRVYGSLDAIINNAAQTVRRPVFYYQHLLENELRPHAELADRVREVVKGDAHSSFMELAASATRAPAVTCVAPAAGASVAAKLDAMQLLGVSAAMRDAAAAPFMTDIAQAVAAVGKEQQAKMEDVDGGAGGSSVCVEEVHADEHKQATSSAVVVDEMHDHDTAPATVARASSAQPNAALLSQLAVVSQDSDAAMKRYFPEGFRDVTGQQLDLRPTNSWELLIDQVEPGELVETFAINALAPFIINSRLIPLMRARADADAGADKASRPRFIVNVSAMEGKFYRFKGPQHVHTNMAKAALNMLTRTSSTELARSNIYMTSVDTGWINDENPFDKATRLRSDNQFQTPIDETDAMARILDPILDCIKTGRAVYGRFLKDYRVTEW